MVKTRHTAYGTEVEFIDPMTARKLDKSLLPQDEIVDLSPADKLKIGAKRWLVDMPKALQDGLKGNNQYTMSDFGVINQLPYYLGGTFLTLSYLAGKDKVTTWQQGLGVLAYYLAFAGAKSAVNALYKARYGVDFGLMYKTPDHRYEHVYGSVSYPRIDLLRPRDFWTLRQKLDIPEEIASPNEAVKHQLPNILSAAWLDRMILGNALAAVATGYLTRKASMKGFPQALKSLGLALRNPKTAAALFSLAAVRAILPKGGHPAARQLAAVVGLGAPIGVLAHALHAETPERYEATGLPAKPLPRLKQKSPGFAAFSSRYDEDMTS
jgi:hypothetical protein